MPTATPANHTPDCLCPDDTDTTDELAQLVHHYRCQRWSTYRIAADTGIDRQRIARMLKQAGVTLRTRGLGGLRPDRRHPDPADLEHLLRAWYVDARMTSGQIADKLGVPERLVRTRLAEAGIARRNRGPLHREDRHLIDPEIIEHWYTDLQLTAAQVAEIIASSRGVVLRNAHDQGTPVRLGGPPARRGPTEIALIDALYADPVVADVVSRHRLPVAPAGPPLYRRFPTPIPLTPELLGDLYCDAGVSTTHVELLTGHPAITVNRMLHAFGVPIRGPGGRCPFLRRWRANQMSITAPTAT